MTSINGIPAIVIARWQEACARPTIARWHSLAQMIASMYVNAHAAAPESPVVDDLRALGEIAHRHALDMQPALEAA